MRKAVHCVSSASTRLSCTDCYHACNKVRIPSEMCVNPKCPTSFHAYRATEVIEIVRFNLRSQTQSITNHNDTVIKRSELFLPNDVVFDEQCQYMIVIKLL